MVNYESIYPGANYLLDPNYGFMGYRIPASELGATTSIQTANQLKEVTNLLNQGITTAEISLINPEVFEMVPKQHIKELDRMAKLTGAELTLHAPIIDPSGFTQQGWSEENREVAERQFEEFVKRGHELSPKGNMPVTIHASLAPGSETSPIPKELIEEYKEQIRKQEKREPTTEDINMLTERRMIAVDQQTGEFIPLEREKVFGPRIPEGEIWTPQKKLESANATRWTDAITNLAFYKKNADDILRGAKPNFAPFMEKLKRGEDLTEEEQKIAEAPEIEQLHKGALFLENVEQSLRPLFEKAAKFPGGDTESKKETKKILNDISMNWKDFIKEAGKGMSYKESILKKSELLDNSINQLRELGSLQKTKDGRIIEINPPEQFKPVESFVKDKASETLSNVAASSYKKFGEKSPVISIENPPYGTALSSGKELKSLIEETRKKFEDKLVKEGKSKGEAKRAAERLIGATWDTSHINILRKQGFGPEKIIEETKEIAPFVKHVHFNDNFGSTHTDLPPGMGEVPMSEVMKELEKAEFKGKKIFEGGNWFQHFQTTPFPYQLQGAGSPLYSTLPATSPYWNQLGIPGAYFIGQGPINPFIHHQTFGAGFTTLPIELGGEMPGPERGRLATAA